MAGNSKLTSRAALDALWPADEAVSATIQIPSNTTPQEIADMAVGQAAALYQKVMQDYPLGRWEKSRSET